MKKPLSLLIIMLMIVSLIIVANAHLGIAQSGTNISGIITTDTTWTQANSPYTFTGPVGVSFNATLTIQAGVTVDISTYTLQVNGTLNAVGNQINPIYINGSGSNSIIGFTSLSKSWNVQTNSGSIIQNAIMNYNNAFGNNFLTIDQVSPKIDNDTINYSSFDTAISVSGGAPTISNCILNGNGGLITGIQLSGSNALVYNNTIYSTGSGIYCQSDNSTIRGNLIVDTNTAIKCSGTSLNGIGAIIENNTIAENTVGIQLDQGQLKTLLFNNIEKNTGYNLDFRNGSNFNATYNWWGTINIQDVNQTIYDFKNNFNYGNVTFSPFLTTPNPQAPTYINASAVGSGSIFPSGIIKVNYGGSQNFIITPNIGYQILDVKVNETSVGAINSFTIQNILGANTISAIFGPNPTPTPSPSPSPSLSPTPSPTSTPTSSPTPTPSPNPTITSPTPSPTPKPTPTKSPTPTTSNSPAFIEFVNLKNNSQNIVFSGLLVDGVNQKPIAGAKINVVDSRNLVIYGQATTNESGWFSFNFTLNDTNLSIKAEYLGDSQHQGYISDTVNVIVSSVPTPTPKVPELQYWTVPLLAVIIVMVTGLLVYFKKFKRY
jgi:hypothetical protein